MRRKIVGRRPGGRADEHAVADQLLQADGIVDEDLELCRLGALAAVQGTSSLADALGAFARRIGLAFQMLDDVLDVSGPVERTGKSRGTDLLDGTVTLPFILAREREQELASVDLASLCGPEQAEALCERIAATGALREARERALAVVAEAKAQLQAILPDGRLALLDLVADAVVERYR